MTAWNRLEKHAGGNTGAGHHCRMDELPEHDRRRGLDILAKPHKHEDLLERMEAALGTKGQV